MARNILILSPLYQRSVLPGTWERNALLAEFLTDECLFLNDDMEVTIAHMRERGYDKPLTKDMASEGRMIHRSIYRYFHDDAFKEKVNFFRGDAKNGNGRHGLGRYLGIACLLKDRPDLKTWEDVERAHDAAVAGEKEQTDEAPAKPEERGEGAEAPDALAKAETPLEAVLAQIAHTGEMMRRIASDVSAYIAQERQRAERDQKRIADLQSENAHLRQQIEEWLRQGSAAAQSIAAVQDVGAEVAYRVLLATHNLPEQTRVSLGGWQKAISIVYSRERGAFCDRMESSAYDKGEKQQVAKTLRRMAQHGPRSVPRETFRRPLPGIPDEIGDFTYTHASHDMRIAWKEFSNKILVFGIYKHTSGAGSSLPDIR